MGIGQLTQAVWDIMVHPITSFKQAQQDKKMIGWGVKTAITYGLTAYLAAFAVGNINRSRKPDVFKIMESGQVPHTLTANYESVGLYLPLIQDNILITSGKIEFGEPRLERVMKTQDEGDRAPLYEPSVDGEGNLVRDEDGNQLYTERANRENNRLTWEQVSEEFMNYGYILRDEELGRLHDGRPETVYTMDRNGRPVHGLMSDEALEVLETWFEGNLERARGREIHWARPIEQGNAEVDREDLESTTDRNLPAYRGTNGNHTFSGNYAD